MVDPVLLTTDIVETSVYLATPPLLWMALFLWTWGDRPLAAEAGFGRRTFWLLLPGALLGTLADLPFFYWAGNFLAINIGGGVIPLVLSVGLLYRLFPDRARLLTVFAIVFAATSYLALVGVFLWPEGIALDLYVIGIGLAAPGAVALLAWLTPDAGDRTVLRTSAALLGITEIGLVATFLSTASVPGLGIVSEFPWYLGPPVAVGIVTVLAAGPFLGLSRRAAIGVAYAATTFGVLVGADVLREPPLYSGSSSGLYAIGGAGTADLLYLSGLLAFATAMIATRLIEGPSRPVAAPSPPAESELLPAALLRRGLVHAVEGRTALAVQDSHAAVEAAIGRANEMLAIAGGASPASAAPRLVAPVWVEGDRTNLAALAQSTSFGPADATRAWMTARWIVRFARSAAREAFASLFARSAAFLVDLLVLTVPAGLLWYYVIVSTPGSITDVLGSVAVNSALLLYTSFGLLYFAALEGLFGSTLGKAVVGLRVRGRGAATPGPRAALLRNLPKLLPLTGIGVFVILGIFLLVHGSSVSVSLAGSLALSVGAVVAVAGYLVTFLAVCGAASGLVMHLTPERQRLGDLLADTWVIQLRARPTGAAVAPAPALFG